MKHFRGDDGIHRPPGYSLGEKQLLAVRFQYSEAECGGDGFGA
jgi:hypothetical protein